MTSSLDASRAGDVLSLVPHAASASAAAHSRIGRVRRMDSWLRGRRERLEAPLVTSASGERATPTAGALRSCAPRLTLPETPASDSR
ncbi:MAG: hypothetical protein AMXMBFR55_27810 [Gemmatimonadota bacterium]